MVYPSLRILESNSGQFYVKFMNFLLLKCCALTVGIFCGVGKPNLNSFLEDFIMEMKKVLEESKIRCIICDSPARAYTKGMFYLVSFIFCISIPIQNK